MTADSLIRKSPYRILRTEEGYKIQEKGRLWGWDFLGYTSPLGPAMVPAKFDTLEEAETVLDKYKARKNKFTEVVKYYA